MLTSMSRTLIRIAILASVLLVGTSAALAQTPQSTPRPTPAPGSPTAPPGQPVLPGSSTPANPTAPPAPVQPNPTTPPGTQSQPMATPVPGAPAVPGGETQPDVNGPVREPNIPQFQARPIPTPPSLDRLGVGSETLSLTLNDVIKRALENNNDIEVARDDVRFAETQLRSLEGVFDPVFSITPTYDKRISPQQSSLGGAQGSSGT